MGALVHTERMQDAKIVIIAEDRSAESNKEMVSFFPRASFIGNTAARIQDNLCFFIISKMLAAE